MTQQEIKNNKKYLKILQKDNHHTIKFFDQPRESRVLNVSQLVHSNNFNKATDYPHILVEKKAS